MKKLYVFDMDGTLLPGTTALLEIAKITGHLKEVQLLEKLYLEQKANSDLFTNTIIKLWKDLTHDHVKTAFQQAPKLQNIKKVLEIISKQGNVSCLITASQDFFANHFYDYGFNYIHASEEYCLNQKTLKNSKPLESKDKVRLAKSICEKHSLPFQETIAFGDSISDVHLFQTLVHTISVNGDHHINHLASHHYRGRDLLEAFHMAEEATKHSPV